MDYTTLIIAIIAGAVCYQLYARLGTRSDGEDKNKPKKRPTVLDGGLGDKRSARPKQQAENLSQDPAIAAEPGGAHGGDTDPDSAGVDDAGAVPLWVNDIRKRYPGFDDTAFIEGAKSAYEMIVTAYGRMDLSGIKPFVQREIYTAFDEAIAAKREKGHQSQFQFVGVDSAEVTAHEVTVKDIFVSVTFTSDQIRSEYDKEGSLVEGDPNRIDFVKDHWRFHRPVNANDPNWMLVATGLV